ncbi:bacteriophage abortive infection AbiH family protein [Shewanella polaris]|uniref:bacteriophage abortive infection AbiH family protein n=1 Tax=Shewanella polaris TaxID=2588449 RepID=UPI00142EC9BA|nr:bacteriophage abortive infection AbiH family protein [Shewanella polaris]
MDKLYIIGNGFDLHHRLPTSFSGFCEYLRLHNSAISDLLASAISYESSDYDIWNRFEENLSFIDMGYLEELVIEYIPSPSDDEYFSDMGACGSESEKIIFNLTEGLRNEFSNYIQLACSCKVKSSLLLNIDPNAIYMSFNYTKTLEDHYGINSDKILYVHGTFDEKENIVLGHAINPATFAPKRDNESPPENLSPEELEQWYEYMSDQQNSCLDDAREELFSYYQRSYKNSDQIIKNNSIFFAELGRIKSIFVLGHSMSFVDIKYFEAIKARTSELCYWTVSFYGETEKTNLEDVLLGLGILPTNFNLIKICNLSSDMTTEL